MPKPDPPPALPTDEDTLNWATRGPVKVRDLTGATLGDFRIERLLGRGGMGEVYLARQTSLNREIAFKVLRPDLLTNPTYLSRFESEAWAAAKLNEPNIVHIYSLGSIDGIRYIAMEYVQGTNLREFLQKKGPPELMLALSIMRQAGTAIKAAGEVGLVHRDIKPENLLLTRKGLVKVADFGLCRDQDREGMHVTQPGTTMGTPLYMSPEQAQGYVLDHRSDLYSLGVTFYHMLSGQTPFKGETPIAIALKHVKDEPVDLSVHRPDLPADLCRLVMKLMMKDPSQRYQSASDMLRDLAKVREATLITINNVPGSANATMPPIPMNDATVAGAPFSSKSTGASRFADGDKRPLASLGPALLFVGLVLGGVVGWVLRPPDLLGVNAKVPIARPALWMAPEWSEVPKQATAELQYRYAQIQAPAGSRAAAWLAVPGYFQSSRDWSSKAYDQLSRRLFRDRDSAKLKVFASELAKMDRAHEKHLAELVAVAGSVLDGDAESASNLLSPNGDYVNKINDPAIAELALEIILVAERRAKSDGLSRTIQDSLRSTEFALIQATLQIMNADIYGSPRIKL
jgi:eukaryotic-like serine/threonine-protein kinase